MTNSQLISRRELLVSLSASALLPYPAILSAAENKMRGALMILSTPYTDDNQVDFGGFGERSPILRSMWSAGCCLASKFKRTAVPE